MIEQGLYLTLAVKLILGLGLVWSLGLGLRLGWGLVTSVEGKNYKFVFQEKVAMEVYFTN